MTYLVTSPRLEPGLEIWLLISDSRLLRQDWTTGWSTILSMGHVCHTETSDCSLWWIRMVLMVWWWSAGGGWSQCLVTAASSWLGGVSISWPMDTSQLLSTKWWDQHQEDFLVSLSWLLPRFVKTWIFTDSRHCLGNCPDTCQLWWESLQGYLSWRTQDSHGQEMES